MSKKEILFQAFEEEGLAEIRAQEEARARFAARVQKYASTWNPPERVAAELRRRDRARRRARELGLAYWPALLVDEPKVDPRAFVLAERWLLRQGHEPWGSKDSQGNMSHGGWDMRGYKGLDPAFVAEAWLRAGCRPSRKFWTQLRLERVCPKGARFARWANAMAGRRWVKKFQRPHFSEPAVFRRLGSDALRALARLGGWSRLAALSGVTPRPDGRAIRARHLNWDAVVAVQNGNGPRSAILAHLPYWAACRILWQRALPGVQLPKKAVPVVEPGAVPLAVVKALLKEYKAPIDYLPYAVQIARVFGRDLGAARRYVRGFAEKSVSPAQALHDAGVVLRMDHRPISAGWARLLAAHPGPIAQMSAVWAAIEKNLGRVPATLAEARSVTAEGLLFEGVSLSDEQREDYLALYSKPHKAWEAIPAPGGADGLSSDKLVLRQLAADDRRQPLAGLLTDCCQHLHGAASSCARASWLRPDAAIWAVFDGYRMVAQSFVWRKDDMIVLDSVEALGGVRYGEKASRIAQLFLRAAQAAVGRLGVRCVAVSRTSYGMTEAVASLAALGEVDNPGYDGAEYSDASSTLRVLARADVPPAEYPIAGAAIEGVAAQAAEAVNELMPGSGVFCEYCEAEVHPDCEICPSCGADISEWVEEDELEEEEDE